MKLFGHRVTPSAQIGIAIVGINVLVAIFAPIIAPYSQAAIVGPAWGAPSAEHWFGLDNLGRDVLSRVVYGAQTTIGISLLITSIAFTVGVLGGLTAAVMGRWVDTALSFAANLILSLPTLIFALVVVSVMGAEIPVLVFTVGLLYSVPVFRLARSVAMNVAVMDYVEAARLRGEGLWWILSREVLPNTMTPLLAEFGLRFCFTFLLVAALSFLGLGIQPPNADWGSMVKETGQMLALRPVALFPAAAIAILTIGVNMVVDWLLAIQSLGRG